MNRAERRASRKQEGQANAWAPVGARLLTDAVRLQQSGRLEEAIASYDAALKHNPSLFQAHYNRGVGLRALGRTQEAIASFRRALEVKPEDADVYNSLGNALADQGQLADAIPCYTRAINIEPHNALAYANLGQALRRTLRLEEAVVCFRRALALDPALSEARFNLGVTHKALGEPHEAIDCFHVVLASNPAYAEAHYNLAVTLHGLDRLDEAVAAYRQAVALRPTFVEALSNLGEALRQQGRLDEAADCLRRALALQPDSPSAINNLGAVLTEQGRTEEAIACFRQALQAQPDFPEAHDALGTALQMLDRPDEAASCYQQSLALRPDFAEAQSNLGIAFQRQGRLDDAIECYRRSIALRPDYAEAHFHLGMALLSRGEMEEGWREYEWRWKTPQMANERRAFSQPQWRGEAGNGRTLLIHAEQGFGDTLQFCRYVSLAVARGFQAVLEVPRPLVRLIQSLPGVAQVVPGGGLLPPFDLHCPMLSLPLALGTTLQSIPGADAYLHPEPAAVDAWHRRLAELGQPRLRVGLVWAGNPRSHLPAAAAVDRRRSIAPEKLAALFQIDGIQFFSLQKDGPVAPGHLPIIDVMNEMTDFADTAALIANLDLIIAVDTSVAHLAGALGRPVWLLDRFDPCWRWFTNRRDSPWYPGLRLYRQAHPGEWDAVVAEVAHDLRHVSRALAHDQVSSQPGDSTEAVAAIERLDPVVFPAGMGISHNDRVSLLLVQKLVRNLRPGFRYLEIASRFGGTVVPFLVDPNCASLVTVGKPAEPHPEPATPAESTVQLASLAGRIHPEMLTKIAAVDCDICTMPTEGLQSAVDLALLDGAHTNATAFRSFMHLLPLLREGGMAVFLDARPILAAIDNIEFLLSYSKVPHTLQYLPDSLAVISLGGSAELAVKAFRPVARGRPEQSIPIAATTSRIAGSRENDASSDLPQPEAQAARAVVVLGARSGTSATAAVLGLLGCALPARLMPANNANVKGYFEPEDIAAEHDSLLRSIGSVWSDWRAIPAAWFASPAARDFRDRLAALYRANYADAALAVLKEPRMCRLLPLWDEIFQLLRVDPAFCFVDRAPLEVAQSLQARDGSSLRQGLFYYIRNHLDAEFATRGRSRVVLRYDDLLADWRGAIERVDAGLNLGFVPSSAQYASVQAFLDRGLRHQHAGFSAERPARDAAWQMAEELHELFGVLAQDPLEQSACRRMDGLRAEFNTWTL